MVKQQESHARPPLREMLLAFTVFSLILGLASAAVAATYLVANTDDSGDGSLRWAIGQANLNAGLDSIFFGLPGSPPHTIRPDSVLAIVTDPVVIDATTQPGFAGTPVIELDGSLTAVTIHGAGLRVESGGSTLRGLVINRFPNNGISLYGGVGNVIEGNYIGTDVTGAVALGNGRDGITLGGSNDNVIGGTTDGARNVISGNVLSGVGIGLSSVANLVLGNYVGTDASGTARLGNSRHGVWIGDDASDNTVGGTTSEARNIVSDNAQKGIYIGDMAANNRVLGNYVGTDVTGTVGLGNGEAGIYVVEDAANNIIGGTDPGAGNLVSNNGGNGIAMAAYTSQNLVVGNYVGTDATGTVALGNARDGVLVADSYGNVVGGTDPGARNVIAGNTLAGVGIGGTAGGNQVIGNYIGTDPSGAVALGNSRDGVWIGHWATGNTLGGATADASNIISDSGRYGIFIEDYTAGNVILGNCIGTDASGTVDLGNAGDGIRIAVSASLNTIGGHAPGEPNRIVHNGGDGVCVSSGTRNCLICNSIHSNAGLGIDLGSDGVTPNDPGDGDTGANGLQNFPVLTSVSSGGGFTSIQGELNSAANSVFTLQFFSSAESDPTGYGEGEAYVGETSVATDGSGTGFFAASFPGEVPLGYVVSATATDANGNTSEFGPVGLVVAVELASFTAVSENGVVRVEWATLSERDNFGFHVHRSLVETGPYVRITDQLIPGAGTSSEPHSYGYVDGPVQAGLTYWYKLADVDVVGGVTMHGPVSVVVLPGAYALYQNTPNPFSGSTTIRFSVKTAGRVTVKIHNVAGELVRTLHDAALQAGAYEVVWDGRDETGRDAPVGTYTCTLGAGAQERARTVLLAR